MEFTLSLEFNFSSQRIRRDLNFLFKSEVKVEKERNLWYPYSLGYVIHLRIFDVRKLWTIGDKTAWM